MSRYLNLVGALSRTHGNDLLAYLALAVAVAALSGAALLFLVLAALALVRRVLSSVAIAAAAGADQLDELLHAGRVVLAERLRQAAGIIDPRPQANRAAQEARESHPAVEATVRPPAAPGPGREPVAQAEPVLTPAPVLMPAAARLTVEAPATCQDTEGERQRLAAALAAHGSIRAAARALGVAESTLRGRLRRHGIEAPSSKRGRKARAATAA
jgi:transcriptional regulator with GAF, ATPase, and Fis domain